MNLDYTQARLAVEAEDTDGLCRALEEVRADELWNEVVSRGSAKLNLTVTATGLATLAVLGFFQRGNLNLPVELLGTAAVIAFCAERVLQRDHKFYIRLATAKDQFERTS